MSKPYDLFSNEAVESFGKALRFAVGKRERGGGEDYTSLVELEYVETPTQFIEVIKKFLRRYDTYARRYEREHPGKAAFRPNEEELDELVNLAEDHGVRNVCSALIAHSLVWPRKKEEKQYE